MIASTLREMRSSQTAGREFDSNLLNNIYRSIQLLPNANPKKSLFFANVGTMYDNQFGWSRHLDDLDKAIDIYQEAMLNAPLNDTQTPMYMVSYGNVLRHRFEQKGSVDDIEKSVLAIQGAIRLTPDGHPHKPSLLNDLGNSLWCRFKCLEDLSDINMSVLVCKDAVRLTPDGHPDKPSWLNNLGNSFLRRFERLWDLSDISMSVSAFEDAVRLTPDGHPDKPSWLDNLGSSLARCFEHLGDLSNINMSVSVCGDAVRLTPDGHPDKPSRLNNLGNSFLRRFEHLGDLSDINMSVSASEDAVRLTPDSHPLKPSWLTNLGHSFLCRFRHLGDLSDINMSISVRENAVQLTPDGHPLKPSLLSSLGVSLLLRFQHHGDLSDIKMAGKVFEKAGKSAMGSFSIRFHACSLWAKYCQLYDHHSLLDAYNLAFHLLPTMAWLGLSIADRQHFLRNVGPMVDEAVSAAIDANKLETAIEWMEQGHSVIWGQFVQLRTPTDTLRQHHPNLADRFTLLSKKLEGASTSDYYEGASNAPQHQTVSTISQNYHELAEERDRLLQHIRGLDGFHQFLLPHTFSQLKMAACNGPVISINVSKLRCNALILMPGLDNILHIPLENFTHKAAEVHYQCLRHLLGKDGRNILHSGGPRNAHSDVHVNNSGAEAVFEHILSRASSAVCDGDRGFKFASTPNNPEMDLQNTLAYLWDTVAKPILDRLPLCVCYFRILMCHPVLTFHLFYRISSQRISCLGYGGAPPDL
jgi:tetratricopeptide (TPR) repeat protein